MSGGSLKVDFRYLIALTWTALIVIGCLVSSSNFKVVGVDKIVGFDKLAHFILYSICAWLWLRAINGKKREENAHYYTFFGLISVGILVECLQATMTTDRSFEFYDILANAVGTLFGISIFLKLG